MRRVIVLTAAALLLAVTASAQSIRIDRGALLKKVERADADIENPKKNTKANTWIDRAKAYSEAATRASSGLYMGMTEEEIAMLYGNPESSANQSLDGDLFMVHKYPYFDAYFHDGLLYFWDMKNQILPEGLDVAFESYQKAYELDSKAASRMRQGMIDLSNYYKENATNSFALDRYAVAAENFKKAYEVQRHPAVNVIDTASLYNAGFLYTISMHFAESLPLLTQAEEYGYYSDGDVYYYMFHDDYGLGNNEAALDVLMQGLSKFPENNKIVEGLIGLYAETNRDPRDILPIVEKAIADDPSNAGLWGGLGRIYDKLGDQDKAIESFQHAVTLFPDDFNANFNLGLLYVKQGDDINTVLSQSTFTNQTEYNNELERVFERYENSLAPLEKALELYPNEPITVELLKNVTFRLRERPGMMERYEKYDELHKQLEGAQ